MAQHFEPHDPLAERPEPEYVELIDPDPPPSIPELPPTFYGTLSGGGRLGGGIHGPGVATWRRWVGYAIAAVIVVPVIVYAIWLFVRLVR